MKLEKPFFCGILGVLLAKSSPQVSLRQHTKDVLRALQHLREIWPQISPGLDGAAIFHDLGKAATGFQQMLNGGDRWGFRHEVLSAAIFRQCYGISDEGLFAAYLAVLTHHRNLGTAYAVGREMQSCSSKTVDSKWPQKWHELITNLDQLKSELAGLDPALDSWEPDERAESPANESGQLIERIQPVFEHNEFAIVRGALVAADHIASAGLGTTVLGHDISLDALERHARDQIDRWKEWSAFQSRVGGRIGSTVLVAPTGAGKTEAALLWALTNRRRFERVFYVLPYQVSINSMASRIAKAFPDRFGKTDITNNKNISVLHANVDMAYLQDAQNDAVSEEVAQAIALHRADAARKIYSPIKVTTVFQLLGIFFGKKFFEVGLLELTGSVVIFDEIHAYDGHTMGLILELLRCLQKLGARILIMTATLPSSLKARLCASAGIDVSTEVSLAADDPLRTEVRRKIVRDDCLIETMTEEIKHAVLSGKRTAVVCNTVSKAIKMYVALSAFNPLLVHSRFTLGDRTEREQKRNIEGHALVIATQVLEVSLDVSFAVMFTELAPADSLLQRFGRVNRHGRDLDPNKLGLCCIACASDEGSGRVYGEEVLRATKAHIPTEPLTFAVGCAWIEKVYPEGLLQEQKSKMLLSSELFRSVTAKLKPMLDPLAEIDEGSPFDSIQVIPVELEADWRRRKEERNHVEAKKHVVNVSLPSWRNAIRNIDSSSKRSEYGETIAPFRYDPDQGLLLDQPLF